MAISSFAYFFRDSIFDLLESLTQGAHKQIFTGQHFLVLRSDTFDLRLHLRDGVDTLVWVILAFLPQRFHGGRQLTKLLLEIASVLTEA